MKKKRLFIDVAHMAIRTLYMDSSNIGNPHPEFDLHRHIFLTTLFNSVAKFNSDEVILALEGRGNWRKKIYPAYKENRTINRSNDIFPWENYYAHMDDIYSNLKKLFPFKVIQISHCEADDIIGVLAKYLDDSMNYVITSDGDYRQLLQYRHISIYDPIKKILMEEPDPKKALEIKILTGDSGDNIPNIKPRVGEKTAIKILDDPDLYERVMNEVVEIKNKDGEVVRTEKVIDNFLRNKKLISFDEIPNVVQKKIIEVYGNYNLDHVEANSLKIMKYFGECRLRKLNEDLSSIMRTLKPLWPQNQVEEFF